MREDDSPDDAVPTLEACDVSVVRGTTRVVDGVSFAARAGSVTGVLGPNGAGKTTLLRALVGLVPVLGNVKLAGKPLTEVDRLARARAVGYVPQRSGLAASLSVREVVAMGRYGHDPLARRLGAADEAAIEDALGELDVGGLGERDFQTCSGGEQRRVLLARALTTGARVLVLDEPTTNLDIRHRLELLDTLRALATRGRAVIVVFHDLDEARVACDQVLLLDRGRQVVFAATDVALSDAYLERVFEVRAVPGAPRQYESLRTRAR